MAEIKPILSAIGTVKSKMPDLAIKNGQLIFIQDSRTIALDFNGKRTFYNQIVTFQTEQERQLLLAPVEDMFYFVIDTVVLWFYHGGWIPVATPPEDIVSITNTLPEKGSEKTLYIDKSKRNVSVWDNEVSDFLTISEHYEEITNDELMNLFN